MNERDLLKAARRSPLLSDGGMGTQLMAAGLGLGACAPLWNVDRPDVIQAVHQGYHDAGCDLITTNAFTASRPALELHGLAERAAEFNEAAARIALRAAGEDAWVLADIGPFGGFLEPLGDMSPQALLDTFEEQLLAAKQGGADAVIVETMSDPAELAVAVTAAKRAADWPVIATYAFERAGEHFVTMMGTPPAHAVQAARDAGADIVGANCGTGLLFEDYAQLADLLLAAAGGAPVIVQPNAGTPRNQNGRDYFPATPQQMADLTQTLLRAGVSIVGGCCGTTPEHLSAMAQCVHARA